MAITKVSNSGFKSGMTKYDSLLAGNEAYIPNSYKSIQTATVGSGGATYVEFTSIPSTYKHLQIRYYAQTNRGTYGVDTFKINVGASSADTGSNYTRHYLIGDGSGFSANQDVSQAYWQGANDLGTTTGGTFGVGVIDILDYASTTKNKTMRKLGGVDHNGTIAGVGGSTTLVTGMWTNSSTGIGYIKIATVNGTLQNYSQFALYGIEG